MQQNSEARKLTAAICAALFDTATTGALCSTGVEDTVYVISDTESSSEARRKYIPNWMEQNPNSIKAMNRNTCVIVIEDI